MLDGSNDVDSHKGVHILALVNIAAHLVDQTAKTTPSPANFGGVNKFVK